MISAVKQGNKHGCSPQVHCSNRGVWMEMWECAVHTYFPKGTVSVEERSMQGSLGLTNKSWRQKCPQNWNVLVFSDITHVFLFLMFLLFFFFGHTLWHAHNLRVPQTDGNYTPCSKERSLNHWPPGKCPYVFLMRTNSNTVWTNGMIF